MDVTKVVIAALLLSCGVILTQAASTTATGRPRTTTWPWSWRFTTTPVMPGKCYYEGKWYFSGEEIYRIHDGDCIYGAKCEAGQVTYWDGYYCFYSKTTTTTMAPTTTPTTTPYDLHGSCPYGSKLYFHNQIIDEYNPWSGCKILMYCHNGQILHSQSSGCETTTRPTPTYRPRPTTTTSFWG